MSEFVINSNINTQIVTNQLAKASAQTKTHIEKLSSGQTINKSSDDPSGLAITTSMKAHMKGLSSGIYNVEAGINMIRFTDSVLDEVQSIFMKIRDLSVRGANEATVNTVVGAPTEDPFCESRQIFKEIMMLQNEVYKKASAIKYNGLEVFKNYLPPDGKQLQIGPDKSDVQTMDIMIPDLEGMGIPVVNPPPGSITSAQFTAAFKLLIEGSDARLETLSDYRTTLGAQEATLMDTLDSLNMELINVASAASSIMDVDYANEVVAMTKTNIISSISASMFTLANHSSDLANLLLDLVWRK